MHYGPLAQQFHRHLIRQRQRLRPPPSLRAGEERQRVKYKTYPRMERIPLAPSPLPPLPLQDIIGSRRSAFAFSGLPLSFGALSSVIGYGAGLGATDRGRPPYPSGGGLYPLETYLIARAVEGLTAGVYHFSVPDNALEALWPIQEARLAAAVAAPSAGAPALVVTSAVWQRNFRQYGDFGYKLILMEAGHLVGNFQLLATACGLQVRSVVNFKEDEMDGLLDIGEAVGEQSLYLTALGMSSEGTGASTTQTSARLYECAPRKRHPGSQG